LPRELCSLVCVYEYLGGAYASIFDREDAGSIFFETLELANQNPERTVIYIPLTEYKQKNLIKTANMNF
jgi:hypothetical protein